MIYTIQCGTTIAKIDSFGAQLRSLVCGGTEYMWPGDLDNFTQTAPVLFPVVGLPKDKKIEVDGEFYPMDQHGFAKRMEFTAGKITENTLELVLESNAETKTMYPFDFKFTVCFILGEKTLDTKFIVENTGSKTLYYGVGGHPGFRCPLGAERFEDWELVFECDEPLLATPVTPYATIADVKSDDEKTNIPHNHGTLPLTRDLFAIEAVVFDNLKSRVVTLRDSISGKGVRVSYPDFPFIAFWTKAAEDAKLLCIEPWQGIAHIENEGYALKDKKGVLPLEAGKTDTKHFLTEIL